jgi:hypothetical protein
MGFWSNLANSFRRIIGGQDQQPAPPPPDYFNEEEVDTTTQIQEQPAPPTTPQEDQIEQVGGYAGDCQIEALYFGDKRVIPKWRIGCAGCAEQTADCVRDLLNYVPNWRAYTVILHGTMLNIYPQKESKETWLSFRFGVEELEDALEVVPGDYPARDVFNLILEDDLAWESIDEVSILNRQPDVY